MVVSFTTAGRMMIPVYKDKGRRFDRMVTVPLECCKRNDEGGLIRCRYFYLNRRYPQYGMPPYCVIKGHTPADACKERSEWEAKK